MKKYLVIALLGLAIMVSANAFADDTGSTSGSTSTGTTTLTGSTSTGSTTDTTGSGTTATGTTNTGSTTSSGTTSTGTTTNTGSTSTGTATATGSTSTGSTSTGVTTSSEFKNTTILPEAFHFSATYSGGVVTLGWTPVADTNGKAGFKYYKLVASHANPNPIYPENGYIAYSTDKKFATYTQTDPKRGANWYRVCAIYDTERICSPVVKVLVPAKEVNKKDEDKKATEKKVEKKVEKKITKFTITKKVWNNNSSKKDKFESVKTSIQLNVATKKTLDAALATFKTALEAKFTTLSDRIAYIDTVIAKAEAAKSPGSNLRASLQYLIAKLGELQKSYGDTSSTIESILQVQ